MIGLTISSIILIICAILMIAVVLLQPGKGDLSATFGGIGSQMGSMFGMQKTANILTRITKYLAIAILLITLLSNKFFIGQDYSTNEIKPVTEGASKPAAATPLAAPPVESPKE